MRLAWLSSLLLAGCGQETTPPPPQESARPELALLTSLPIAFAEQFTLDVPSTPLLTELEGRYRVQPVDGPEPLKPGGLLLAIQPQALTAERLVALDGWVRAGGRMILLADPALTFESSRPLGDRFRPPFSFPDRGLLAHWGLTLEEEPSPVLEVVPFDLGNGITAEASSMGSLSAGAGTGCTLSASRRAARCRLGKGGVTVVADADFAMRPSERNAGAVRALVDELAR